MTIAHAEMAGSPTELWDYKGFKATRKLLVDWLDRFTAVEGFLTFPGELYPYNTSINARARSGAMQPFPAKTAEDVTGRTKYDKAIITIGYQTPDSNEPHQVDDVNIVSESLEPTAEFMTLDVSDFRWDAVDGEPLKEGEAPGRLMVGFDYVLTRYNVPNIPTAALTLVGHVNQAARTSYMLGLTYPAETLLYNPPTIQKVTSLSGDIVYTITYRFTYAPQTWNKFWRVGKYGGAGYSQIFHEEQGLYRNYPLGDFGLL